MGGWGERKIYQDSSTENLFLLIAQHTAKLVNILTVNYSCYCDIFQSFPGAVGRRRNSCDKTLWSNGTTSNEEKHIFQNKERLSKFGTDEIVFIGENQKVLVVLRPWKVIGEL